ncbi:hypothetical protein BC833DRAFT_586528 [Globomyces pollinis-pini]|nr:hypothetical protein BC833DRAFT_586528 [Globomyces pollinis-pini]
MAFHQNSNVFNSIKMLSVDPTAKSLIPIKKKEIQSKNHSDIVINKPSNDSNSLHDKAKPTINDIPKWNSFLQIFKHAFKGGARAFALAFLIRGGITFAISMLKKKRALCIDQLKNAAGIDTHRFARMVGGFAFVWKLVNNSLLYITKEHSKKNGAIAGALAGLCILFEPRERRVGYAQQFFMRSMQAGKNAFKQRNIWTVPHGDTLLFVCSCASILYGYAYRPETIPREYYSWMIKKARVPKEMLLLQAAHVRKQKLFGSDTPADVESFKKVFDKVGGTKGNLDRFLQYVKQHKGALPGMPCCVFHPKDESCTAYCVTMWGKVFIDIVPVYLALTGIPMLILKTKSIIAKPIEYIKRIAYAVTRSSIFLASYLSFFQTGMCLFSNILPDTCNKYWTYILGGLCGFTVLFEQKPKRSELAMYSFPKGLQSFYLILLDRGNIPNIPHLDVMFGSAAMSIIMSLYQLEPHHMSSILYKIMRAIIGTY